jgi:hypothetical protein
MVTRASRVQEVTAWMERPVGLARLLEAWGFSLVRLFADFPAVGPLLWLGLLPLGWVVWRFCVTAPARARLLVCLLFLLFAAVVLVPDMAQGGSRSLHPRYVLPGLLALELAAAYVLAAGSDATSPVRRAAAHYGLLLVFSAGLGSYWLVLGADTWWSKNFSAQNREVAKLVSGTERPLLIVTDSGVGLGEVISLAYDLEPRVTVRGEPRSGQGVSTAGFSDIFLLTPSAELRAALATEHELTPVLGTWQWYRAIPRSPGAGI